MADRKPTIVTIIPARPGYYAVEPVWSMETPRTIESLSYDPIIAWAIEIESERRYDTLGCYVTGVTVEGHVQDTTVIKMPSGSFVLPQDREFNTAEKVMEYFKKERNE